MKNKLLLITLFLTANAGFCETTARDTVIHSAFVKFGFAMGGVLISSLIIYAGLTIYNKFFVKSSNSYCSDDELTKTPKTTDEAIKFFIRKNRLK